MFYTADTGMQHTTTYFNRTIDIVEPHTWVDFQALFLFVLILAALGGLGQPFSLMSCLLCSLLEHTLMVWSIVLIPPVCSLSGEEEQQPCKQLRLYTPPGCATIECQVVGFMHAGPPLAGSVGTSEGSTLQQQST